MNDPKLHDLLEAFRPGVDRLEADEWGPLREALADDGQLRSRFESIRQGDRSIHRAMHEVALPSGLTERLLTSVRVASTKPDLLDSSPAATVVATDPVPQPERDSRQHGATRRAWGLIAGGILSVAAAIALVVLNWPAGVENPGLVSREQLAGDLQTWLSDDALRSPQGWSQRITPALLSSHPVDPNVQVTPSRWRRIPTGNGETGVVYELPLRGGRSAYLFVVNTPRTFNVPTLPMAKWSLSGGRVAGAWQRGHVLYALVVDEDGISIEDLVRIPRVA
jgi:hypothetical protein